MNIRIAHDTKMFVTLIKTRQLLTIHHLSLWSHKPTFC